MALLAKSKCIGLIHLCLRMSRNVSCTSTWRKYDLNTVMFCIARKLLSLHVCNTYLELNLNFVRDESLMGTRKDNFRPRQSNNIAFFHRIFHRFGDISKRTRLLRILAAQISSRFGADTYVLTN